MTPERAREIEPHVSCVSALLVQSTGITDYGAVARAYQGQLEAVGGEVLCGTEVLRSRDSGRTRIVETTRGDFEAGYVVNCAGLHSDRVARASGTDPRVKIVPFRGEYFELVSERRGLVKSLIYPVPDPDFPFLGVHFTRMIGGGVHAGPNAVLAFTREGYRKTNFRLGDFAETMTFAGFWRLALKHGAEGFREAYRSLSKKAFTRSLQRLVPEVRTDDLIPCDSGIRAQALTSQGSLVDDFLLLEGRTALHVCNAPSPGATASLEIGKEVARRVPDVSALRRRS
jgi:L-2-hydroxyglutarate oxidase